MGKIRTWFNKYEKGILAGLAIGGITVSIGGMSIICYNSYKEYLKTVPEGAAVKTKADGVITKEEESEIASYLTYGKPQVFNSLEDVIKTINAGPITKEYDNTISGLVNDFNVFLVNQFKWKNNKIGDRLHIVISNNKNIEKSCNINPWYGGCYKGTNSTIYLKECSPVGMLEGIEHEIGHSLRNMPRDNNYLKELPSQANEFYAYFRLNSLNRTIGTYYAKNNSPTAMEYVSTECKPDSRAVPYMLGALGFLVQANKAEGDLELAMQNVLNAGISQLEKDTKDSVSKYGNMCLAYKGEYENLLKQPEFAAGMETNMSKEEAQAFINLLYTKISQ
ncbi:MAG: hypothetical protein WC852_03910 [Candidatus Nanoarchaeia archaeon]|jgi:hypothetical protein